MNNIPPFKHHLLHLPLTDFDSPSCSTLDLKFHLDHKISSLQNEAYLDIEFSFSFNQHQIRIDLALTLDPESVESFGMKSNDVTLKP